jgi:hypothetical protein
MRNLVFDQALSRSDKCQSNAKPTLMPTALCLWSGYSYRHIAGVYPTGAGEVNEAITDTALGENIAWIRRVFFNLLAQIGNVQPQ